MKGWLKPVHVLGLGAWVCSLAVGGLKADPVGAVVIDRIVAVVNKDIITLSEVQEAGKAEFTKLRKRYGGQRLKNKMEEVQRKYLDLLITRRLQVHRAKEMNLSSTDTEVDRALEDVKRRNQLTDKKLEVLLKQEGLTLNDYRQRIGEEILVRKVVNLEVRSRVSVTPEEVRAYYDSHMSEFVPPEQLRARHILFLTPANTGASVERAKRAAAEEVLAKIRAGADFAEMARRYSQDPSASRGGDLGVIRRGEVLPNFERTLFAMKESQVSDVVRTRAGFHIIKLDKRLTQKPKPFSELEARIRNKIFREKAEARFTRWMEELKKKAYIEVSM
ncbi:MAG: peptidylprolyl isomerase [Nitrospinota bacterium]